MSQIATRREHLTVAGDGERTERGRLSFRVGATQAERHTVTLFDATTVCFGRGEQCAIRIGHAPLRDPEIPRIAGWLVMANQRVIVEAAPMSPSGIAEPHRARRALQVTYAGGPPVPVPAGAAFTPATTVFTVEVVGATQIWELDVAAHARDEVDGEAPGPLTNGIVIDLTDEQREVLRAYAEPVLAGGVEPATHDQVAAKVYMSRSQVRRHLERLSDAFYQKRLWSPESGDTRVRVVEAARHNLLLAESGPAPDPDLPPPPTP